jgi:hypothetical protein
MDRKKKRRTRDQPQAYRTTIYIVSAHTPSCRERRNDFATFGRAAEIARKNIVDVPGIGSHAMKDVPLTLISSYATRLAC